MEQQPVVFLGSEGDTAVLARDAADLLWLLAHGRGPVELLHMDEDDEDQPGPHPELMAAARELAPDRDRPVEQIRTDAATVAAELPDLVEWLGPPR
ncbi:MAG: hypothetical protein FWH11_12615 [Micrococcales bacterium]|nr:hypothetical protein [Micrococcales bacterium]